MLINLSLVEKHARVASFNNSELQLEFTKASNQIGNGESPVEKHARDASFNNSESQSEIIKASNQLDLDLSNKKWRITR